MKRIVVVGFGSAGITAAATARMVNREAEIKVIERRPYAIHHPCGIPFAIGGEIPDIKKLIEPTSKLPKVEVQTETEAVAIDADKKTIEVSSLKTGKRETLEYDALILTMGSYPFKPPIPGIDLKNVYVVNRVEDGQSIIDALKKAKNAVIIGAGVIGIETAVGLKNRGLEVKVVEMLSSTLPKMLDPDMADLVTKRLNELGIEGLCGQAVKEIRGEKRVQSVLVGERELPADLVIVAVGVRPEIGLAKAAGITLGKTGGIKVDDHFRTSIPGIYAAGDCAESFCLITKCPILSQFATTAIRMGKVVGTNSAGGDATFPGVLNTAVTCVPGMEIASTGLTTHAAKEAGIEPIAGRIRTLDKPSYYPGAEPIFIKLLVEPKERKLIGGQVIGAKGAAERVNLLALATQRDMTIEELAQMEYCYAPPVTTDIEPIVMATEAVLRRL